MILTGEPLAGACHPKHALLAYRLFAETAHGHGAHQKADKNAGGHEHQGHLPRRRKHERLREQAVDGERTAVLVRADLRAPGVDADGGTAAHFVVRVRDGVVVDTCGTENVIIGCEKVYFARRYSN